MRRAARAPASAGEAIVSVPHSGTRTLVALLELGRLPGGRRWWHFGSEAHAARLRRFGGTVHIPLRHPRAVARSWARRPIAGQPVAAMLRSYAAMLAFVSGAGDRCHLHVMETLPRLAGTDEYPGLEAQRPRLRRFERALEEAVLAPHRAFWGRFYPELAR